MLPGKKMVIFMFLLLMQAAEGQAVTPSYSRPSTRSLGVLGQCEDLELNPSPLGTRGTLGTSGLIVQSLSGEALMEPRNSSFYSSELPQVEILEAKTTCKTFSGMRTENDYQTIAMLVKFRCRGVACRQREEEVEIRTYLHHFAFFCQNAINEFGLYDTVKGFRGSINREPQNSLTNTRVAQTGSCRQCRNYEQGLWSASEYDEVTGCLRCSMSCSLIGTGQCVTTLDDTLSNYCCHWRLHGRCVSACPAPYFKIESEQCKEKVKIEPEENILVAVCPGDRVTYFCDSINHFGYAERNLFLSWTVIYPGEDAVSIMYDTSSPTNFTRNLGLDTTSVLVTRSREFLKSSVTLTVPSSSVIMGTVVTCSLRNSDIQPESIAIEILTKQGPHAPFNIRIVQRRFHSNSSEELFLQWDSVSDPVVKASSYEFSVIPTAVFPLRVEPPFSIISVLYNATLTAVNCMGRSPLHLEIGYTVYLMNEETGEMSSTVLEINGTHGERIPRILCYSNGYKKIRLTWTRNLGQSNLPYGARQRSDFVPGRQSQWLLWERAVRLIDSGIYTCSSSNNLGSNFRVQLRILINKTPTITSIFPNHPQVSGSFPDYKVPVNFRSRVLICNVIGWPPPAVEWVVPSASQDNSSQSRQFASIFTTATLQFPSGFSSNDSGLYSCGVEAGGEFFQSRDFNLTENTMPLPVSPLSPCTLSSSSNTVQFRTRVLTRDCDQWNEGTVRGVIESDIAEAFASGIAFMCKECSIDVELSFRQCSSVKPGAAVFSGSIRSTDMAMTKTTFCAIRAWIEFRPLIRLVEGLSLIDPQCMVQTESAGMGGECYDEPLSAAALTQSDVGASLGVLFTVMIILTVGNVILAYLVRRRWIKRKESILTKKQVQTNSMYDDDIVEDVGERNQYTNVYRNSMYNDKPYIDPNLSSFVLVHQDDLDATAENDNRRLSKYYDARSDYIEKTPEDIEEDKSEIKMDTLTPPVRKNKKRAKKPQGGTQLDTSNTKIVATAKHTGKEYKSARQGSVDESKCQTVHRASTGSEADYITVYQGDSGDIETEYKTVIQDEEEKEKEDYGHST